MSINSHFGEEEGILSNKHFEGHFKRGLQKFVALFLCAAIVFTMTAYTPTKTEAAVKLTVTSKYMKNGDKFNIGITGANAKKVTWSLSNPFVGTLVNGVFTANYPGMTKIYANYKNKTYTCKVVVRNKYRVLNFKKYSVKINDKSYYDLKVKALGQVKFRSENSAIAKVNANGRIYGVNPGTTHIIAENGWGFRKCKVKVVSAGVKKVTYAKWLYNQSKLAIRKKDNNGNFKYGPLTATAGKSVELEINNIKSGEVKKVVWSSENKRAAEVIPTGKIKAQANALAIGSSKISAVVFYNSGKTELLTNTMHISKPTINNYTVFCFTKSGGKNRHQYVSFTGLPANSKVTYKVSKKKKKYVKATIKNNKCKLLGKKPGHGTVTAKVNGKTYKVNYYVFKPKFNSIGGFLTRGSTTKIKIDGISKIPVTYSSRNANIASVSADGTITGVSAGVTYIDVNMCNMNYTYRVEVAAKGMKTIINRAKYIVNNWIYSQGNRMSDGYYDCSALVWKGYAAYKNYNAKLGSKQYALPAAYLFDYLRGKQQIISLGFVSLDDLAPGDLFFYGDYNSAVRYSTPGRTLNIYHVAMYAGNGRVVEKGTPKYTYNNLDHIVGVGRVVSQ